MAATVTFTCTAKQFGDLFEQIQDNPGTVKKLTMTEGPTPSDPYPASANGLISTSDVDLSFTFVEPTLTVSVLKANSFLARHASDTTLESHLVDIFNKYLLK
jgi:hypothetical protein